MTGFSEKWISTPKQYSGVVFPSTVLLQMKNATKLMQRIRNISKTNTYYLFGSDLEMFSNSKYCQNELLCNLCTDLLIFAKNSIFADSQKLPTSSDHFTQNMSSLFHWGI